jgi:hypothetical protein
MSRFLTYASIFQYALQPSRVKNLSHLSTSSAICITCPLACSLQPLWWCRVPRTQCVLVESRFAAQIQLQAKTAETGEVVGEREQHQAKAKRNRWLAIDLGGVVGGVLIGVTGGLAAPLVAAERGTPLGTGTGAALATTVGVYTIGSLFAAGGTGLLVRTKKSECVGCFARACSIANFELNTWRCNLSDHPLALPLMTCCYIAGPQSEQEWEFRRV